jgi:hypothetical protein
MGEPEREVGETTDDGYVRIKVYNICVKVA